MAAWWGWGDNEWGQATPPAGVTGVVAIAAGTFHSLALKSDGTVVGWGVDSSADFGQATPPSGLTNAVAISAKYTSSAALKGDGTVVTWGQWLTPTGLSEVVAVSMGDSHLLAVADLPAVPSGLTATTASTLHINLAWTNNASNEDGFKVERSTDGTNFTQIAQVLPGHDNLSRYWSVARHDVLLPRGVRTMHSVTQTSQTPPAPKRWTFARYKLASSAGARTCSVNRRPPGIPSFVAIAAGYYHSLALRADGTVVGWGLNGSGQTTPPAGLTGCSGGSCWLVPQLGTQIGRDCRRLG